MPYEVLIDASSTVFVVERQHSRNAGTIALPVYGVPLADNPAKANGITPVDGTGASSTSTPTACRVVRLHAPIEAMVITWMAVKEGAAPTVPNPYLYDKNLVFKRGQRSGQVPMPLPGYSGHAWSIAGWYEYHMLSPTDLNSAFPLGTVPWETALKNVGGTGNLPDAAVPSAAFVSTILEAVAIGGGPGA